MLNVQLALSYAALIIADEGGEITPDKLQAILIAANIVDVEQIWINLFVKALEDKDMKTSILNGCFHTVDSMGDNTALAVKVVDPTERIKTDEVIGGVGCIIRLDWKDESDEDVCFCAFH